MARLFDKVVVKLNKGISSVSEGSKIVVEKAQLNTQMSDVEKERNKLYQNLGALVYNLQESGVIDIPQCSGICIEISKMNNYMDAIKEQLKALEVPMEQSLPYNEYEEFQNGIRCSCGHLNKESARFCAKCGNSLTDI